METIQGLNELIKNRLIEKNGSIILNENKDIIEYGKILELNENQLLFKVLDIQETINWTEEERKKNDEIELKSKEINDLKEVNSVPFSSAHIIYCGNCNASNEKENAKFCSKCGNKLKSEIKPITIPTKKNTFLIALGIISGGLAILILVYNFWGTNDFRNKSFKKTKDGVEYLIVKDEKGENAKIGDIIEYNMLVKIGDSVMYDSRKMNDNKPVQMALQDNPSANKSMDPTEVIKMMSAGDSAVVRVGLDSMARKIYPFAKETDKLEFQFSMVSIKSKEKFEAEMKEKSAAQAGIDDKLITEYLKASTAEDKAK
jgi:ASC-1-like (ASCH) protein